MSSLWTTLAVTAQGAMCVQGTQTGRVAPDSLSNKQICPGAKHIWQLTTPREAKWAVTWLHHPFPWFTLPAGHICQHPVPAQSSLPCLPFHSSLVNTTNSLQK